MYIRILLLIILLIFSSSLKASCERPDVLRFSIIPAEHNTEEIEAYKPLLPLLKTSTELDVEIRTYDSYAAVVMAMNNRQLDIAMLGPYSYILMKTNFPGIEAFVTYSHIPGVIQEAGAFYRSLLIVRASSGFNNIASLEGSILALQNPGSTSGFLIPMTEFSDVISMPLKQYFEKTLYSGSHDRTAVAVSQKKVDAGFISSHRLQNFIDKEIIGEDQLRILWKSEPIPLNPFVFRSNLCADLKQKLIDTFLSLKDNPAGAEALRRLHMQGFVKIKDSDYDVIRKLYRRHSAQDTMR
ncbi:MAG: phosphate/phosphite/phosphonate ABC transporter substrate-binding protein [Pseudomonadales bacterium]|nr:phosphate/phosphite/phosphonate ABC transporter substrate-binding protein [Pseudomonadales bacterium]